MLNGNVTICLSLLPMSHPVIYQVIWDDIDFIFTKKIFRNRSTRAAHVLTNQMYKCGCFTQSYMSNKVNSLFWVHGEYTAAHTQLRATVSKSALTGTHLLLGRNEVPCSRAQRADATTGYRTRVLTQILIRNPPLYRWSNSPLQMPYLLKQGTC